MKTEMQRQKEKELRKIQIHRRIILAISIVIIIVITFCLGFLYGIKEKAQSDAKQEVGIYDSKTTETLTVGCWNDINDTENVVVEETDTEIVQSSYFDTECENYEYLGWTNDDYVNLAKICYSEAGSQGWDCMVAVGSVILNRLKYGESWQTGDSILEVWSRSGEYTTYKNRNYIEPSEDAYYVSEFLLENGSQLPSYVLYQHGNGKAVAGTTVYCEINGEVFSY